jgi:hypothetical protein
MPGERIIPRSPDPRYLKVPVDVLPPVSVVIPSYEMHGQGEIFLRRSLEKLKSQTFKRFEVVVSDHSQSDLIKDCCEQYAGKLEIRYLRNTNNRGSSCANANFALDNAKHDLIRILFQDDFLAADDSLERASKYFFWKKAQWMVTACNHLEVETGKIYWNHFPRKFEDKHLFEALNPLGCPSVLMVKKSELRFDLRLPALMDVDYYFLLKKKFGPPVLFQEINATIGIHKGMVTNNGGAGDSEQVKRELVIVNEKFGKTVLN